MKLSNKIIVGLIVVGAMTALTGCHLFKKYDINDVIGDNPLLKEYVEAANQTAREGALGTLTWQTVYTDPILAGYIQRALDNNTDLANAKLNIDIAYANMEGARLSFFPSVAVAPTGSIGNTGRTFVKTYQIPLSVSWEADIFGRLTNAKRGYEATYAMTQDYEQAVRSQIIAGVANCYYAVSALKQQIQLSRETAEVWKKNVQTMKDYKEAGRTNEAAVKQSEANYYSVLSSISDMELSVTETLNTMSLLMNEMPQNWEVPTGLVLEMPGQISQGVPMVELANRPDVRAAERNLAVAYYATQGARAAFYPSLNISASLGLTNPGKFFTNLVGSLTAPIFSRGQNKARLEISIAQQQQVLNTFSYTLMSAAVDVNNALTMIERNREKLTLLNEQVDAWTKSVEYTNELFFYGSATYLEILTAQSGLLSAQMSVISCNLARTQGIISLYQSLGGGGIPKTQTQSQNEM